MPNPITPEAGQDNYQAKIDRQIDQLLELHPSPALTELLTNLKTQTEGVRITQDNEAHQIAELVAAPELVKVGFEKLSRKFIGHIGTITAIARAIEDLDSPGKVRTLIINEFTEAYSDPYHLRNHRDAMPGEAYSTIYEKLALAVAKGGAAGDEHEKLKTRLMMFEEAAFGMLLDPDTFFTKNKTGNEGTISEFVGTMVACQVPSEHSPTGLRPENAGLFQGAVELDKIVSG